MVIIEVRTSRGVVGRCDASCYNAKEDRCECICGGANHGVGLKIAVEDRQYLTDDEIIANVPGLKKSERAAVYNPLAQNTLWGAPVPVPKKTLDSWAAGR